MNVQVAAVVGEVVQVPELEEGVGGVPAARVCIAHTPRRFDPLLGCWQEAPAVLIHGLVRGERARAVPGLLHAGDRVLAIGAITESALPSPRSGAAAGDTDFALVRVDMTIHEIGPALRAG